MIIYEKIADNRNYGAWRNTANIKWIVMHYTANDGDTAKANANYFANNVVKASAHYFVDDNSVYRSVPDDYVAWSVGGSKYSDCATTGGGKYHGTITNTNSISVEMCDTVRDGRIDVTNATLNTATDLVRMLMNKYNIDINHVVCHFDVTGKACPNFNGGAWIYGERKDFKKFKAMLEGDDMTADEVRNIVREEIDAALKGYNSKPSKWAEPIIKEAKDKGITDGSRPLGYAKREEVAAMVLKGIKISEDDGR